MKCHAFCACNKIVIDKEGAHSLIEIMLNAEIQLNQVTTDGIQAQITVPTNAVSPTQWWLYTQWEPASEDVGKRFEQVFQIYWPEGEKFAENRLEFTQKDDRVNQTSFYYLGFPVGQQGKLRLVTWIDHAGLRFSDIIESHVLIKHKPVSTLSPGPYPNPGGV